MADEKISTAESQPGGVEEWDKKLNETLVTSGLDADLSSTVDGSSADPAQDGKRGLDIENIDLDMADNSKTFIIKHFNFQGQLIN